MIKTASLFCGVLASLILSGCATDPGAQQALIADASRPVTCSNQADCAAKWSRAVQWVTMNSAYKVQSSSDLLIQTMGPLPNDPRPAFTVTRMNNADGSGVFSFTGGCDNIFGCVPSMLQEQASFVDFVIGPPSQNAAVLQAPAIATKALKPQ